MRANLTAMWRRHSCLWTKFITGLPALWLIAALLCTAATRSVSSGLAAAGPQGRGAAGPTLTTLIGDAADGLPARGTPLWRPAAVAEDKDGAIYIADDGSRSVRRIDPATGIATVVVGREQVVDDQARPPNTLVFLKMLDALAIDARRNVYIAGNQRIWRFGPLGLTTIAGTGVYGHSGDGGAARRAQMGHPHGIALDAQGNIFFSDADHGAIRRVDAATGTITTVAGGPGRPIGHPWGVALDAAGNIFYADPRANSVSRIEPATGRIQTVARADSLVEPYGVAVAANGDLFISHKGRVSKVEPGGLPAGFAGGALTTLAGGGHLRLAEVHGSPDGKPGSDVRLENRPGQLSWSRRNVLLIALPDDNVVAQLDLGSGRFSIVAGNPLWIGDGSRTVIAPLARPQKVALDRDGNLYVADSGHERVLKAERGPRGIGTGKIIVVAGTGVAGVSPDGTPAAGANITSPAGVAVDSAGTVFFTDRGERVRRIGPAGVVLTVAGTTERGFSGDDGPAVSAKLNDVEAIAPDTSATGLGNIYIADSGNRRVRVVDARGTIRTLAGAGDYGDSGDGGPAAQARFTWITDLLLDGRGGLLVADSNSGRIRRIDLASRTISTMAMVADPRALARDAQGNIYVAGADGMRRIDAVTGAVTSWAAARLGRPSGLVTAGDGSLIFSDSESSRIRRITP